ncbi:MAG: UDP-2,3-diacylglucosamine diphosphatase [Microscillaceae bacterium]|jgi:UDP-2,3-diacylglucosamine hydrolase|nr:UDP-2,3-diacylglucosamine diphosphatase [Microscillaceae bacterium]
MTSPITLTLPANKKIFFASDFHLGAPTREASLKREKKIVRWLEKIEAEAGAIFLVGDIFDFWFEYWHAVPRGYTRLLGKLAQLSDAGIPIIFFTGNHDMWMFDYFKQELNGQVFRQPQVFLVNDKKLYVAHGDGLGPGDYFYKFLKLIFRNKVCQWLFARLHPNFGIGLASFLSRRSRARNLKKQADEKFLGEDREWLIIYSKELEQATHHDFYIYGHRHLPLDFPLNPQSRYINLGEWLTNFTYAVFDGKEVQLYKFEE